LKILFIGRNKLYYLELADTISSISFGVPRIQPYISSWETRGISRVTRSASYSLVAPKPVNFSVKLNRNWVDGALRHYQRTTADPGSPSMEKARDHSRQQENYKCRDCSLCFCNLKERLHNKIYIKINQHYQNYSVTKSFIHSGFLEYSSQQQFSKMKCSVPAVMAITAFAPM
jgi:hypothetical protein